MAPDEIEPDEQPGAGPDGDPPATGEQAERPEGATEGQSPWAKIRKRVSDWFDRQP